MLFRINILLILLKLFQYAKITITKIRWVKVISEIPKEKYENIFKGAYERPEKYVPKNKTRKIKKNYK